MNICHSGIHAKEDRINTMIIDRECRKLQITTLSLLNYLIRLIEICPKFRFKIKNATVFTMPMA